jgi:hypothetical protein
MRSTVKILVVMALALGAVALAAAPGGAGASPTNTFTVVKHVTGPVPAGTTFTVEVTCEPLGLGTLAPTPDLVITFDATGTPTTENSVTTSAGSRCTAVETANGTAVGVAYQCSIQRGNTDQIGPPFLGNCGPDDNQATFGDVIGDAATITVTNSFVAPITPPVTPVTPAAQAVQAAPAFTG